MAELERHLYWSEQPAVRIVSVASDGSLTGRDTLSARHFGGHIPQPGDVIGSVWGDKEYDGQIVQRRYFINEYLGDIYWVLVVRDVEPSPQFDALSSHLLLITDLDRLFRKKKRTKRENAEILNRLAELTGSPLATRKFKPKRRPVQKP